MKYMLLIYAEEVELTPSVRDECYAESLRLVDELRAKGQFIDASPLQPVDTATSVRIRNEKRFVTDGPFAETAEQLGGFFLIDVENLDEALAIASRLPSARFGAVEVRPVVSLPGV